MNHDEKLNELIAKHKELGEQIEALKNEMGNSGEIKRFWKPKIDETYIYITAMFGHSDTTMRDGEIDSRLTNAANCYKESEKELVEKDVARMKARQIIQRTADMLHGKRYEFRYDFNNYAVWSSDKGTLIIGNWDQRMFGAIYFETKELAERCLKDCEAEYKILLGVSE